MRLRKLQTWFLSKLSQRLKLRKKRRVSTRSFYRPMTIKTVTVRIQVLDPITGSKYRGYLIGISKRSILRELKLHSSWNKLDKMIVPKGSILAKFTDKDWEDYPLILKSGNEKFPYVVDTINRDPYKPQTIQVNLHSVENMAYIEAVALKKRLVKAMKDSK